MKNFVRVEAPGKVNLALDVVGRRADGYHRLRTVFAKIELSDVLTLSPAPRTSLEIVNRSPTPVPLKDNLVLRAVGAYRRRFGGPPVRARLMKRIPAGAGLGGGSSDAAAALKGMAMLQGNRRSLFPLAKKLGADVSFFLRSEPLCIGTGAGDRLSAVSPARRLRPWAVVVWPCAPQSTPEAYRALGLRRGGALTRISYFDKLLKALKAGAPLSSWSGLLFNRLEDPVFRIRPESAQACGALNDIGARARLSGSGSCVFALASSERIARRWAASVRRGRRWKTYVTRILG